MKYTDICTLDAQGRIVIPTKMRKTLNLVNQDALEAELSGREIHTYWNREKRSAAICPLEEEHLSIDRLLPTRIQKAAETLDSQKQLVKLLAYITPKEMEVVRLKADGYTYQEIAEKCRISVYGVESRFSRMRQRLRALALM